jgi:GTP-binding protein LepA
VGVVMLVRVVDGRLLKGERFKMMATNTVYNADNLGVFTPANEPRESLEAGEVGYIIAGIKELQAAKVGDTITLEKKLPNNLGPAEALPGFKEVQPQVFAGLYPTEASEYDALRDALEKLKLNDAALHYEPEVSQALGFGFRCGFLGLLHMEIVQERLEREFRPGPDHHRAQRGLPGGQARRRGHHGREPVQDARPGSHRRDPRAHRDRAPVHAAGIRGRGDDAGQPEARHAAEHGLPRQAGHADLRHAAGRDRAGLLRQAQVGQPRLRVDGLRVQGVPGSDVVKVDILLNGEKVDALSIIVHRSQSQYRGRAVAAKMREIISRQQFDVAIQAAIGGNVIARETIKALRKNVLAKCYGGDITRKRKLLEKQKAGKKRMKQIGSVEVPQEAFSPSCRWRSDAADHGRDHRGGPGGVCRLRSSLFLRRDRGQLRAAC